MLLPLLINSFYCPSTRGSLPQPLLVVDFGLSEYEDELSPESAVCGTASYLAPEVGE